MRSTFAPIRIPNPLPSENLLLLATSVTVDGPELLNGYDPDMLLFSAMGIFRIRRAIASRTARKLTRGWGRFRSSEAGNRWGRVLQ
jgi:hypothetical protein